MAFDETFDVPWLNRTLDQGGMWEFGAVKAFRTTRIGAGYGLSGHVYRLDCALVPNGRASLVVKIESADKIQRAVTFRMHNQAQLIRSIPVSYGWEVQPSTASGVILLEDVAPARQGDNLIGCTAEEAQALIEVIARVHALALFEPAGETPDGVDRWTPQPWDQERWEDRLATASRRYPEQYTNEFTLDLAGFNDEANDALFELGAAIQTWIHQDPHLDNVLWWPDGTPILLDWSDAVIGPPGIDVAVLLLSLAFRDSVPISPEALLESYGSSLGRHGVDIGEDQLAIAASQALRPLIRGMIGWAGFPGSESIGGRQLALRDDSVSQVLGAIRWLSSQTR